MVPGMHHCLGEHFETNPTTDFDSVSLLKQWKASGRISDTIVVTQTAVDGKASKRLVCADPQVAEYRGKGDTGDPASSSVSSLDEDGSSADLQVRCRAGLKACATLARPRESSPSVPPRLRRRRAKHDDRHWRRQHRRQAVIRMVSSRRPVADCLISTSDRPEAAVDGDGRSRGRRPRRGPACALPLRLVAVHPAVGGGQQRLVRVAVVREHRGADADAELQPLAGPRLENHVVDRRLQLQALALGLVAPQPDSTTMNSSPA